MMSISGYETFLTQQARRLVEGDIAGLMEVFRAPLPIYHPDGMQLMANTTDVRTSIQRMMATFRRLGVRDVHATLLDHATRQDSSTVGCLMEFRYLGRDDIELRKTAAWYYLETDETGYFVVMLDYRKAGFPEVFPTYGEVIPLRRTKS